MKLSQNILITIFFILGLFILGSLFNQFLNSKPEAHIGCYLHDQQLNKTAILQSRIANIKQQHRLALSVAYLYPSLVANQTNFQHTSVQVAKSFEGYLQKLTQRQNFNKENFHILTAVHKAEQQYLTCKMSIQQDYKENDCLNNWQQYEGCFVRLQGIRATLQQKVRQGQLIKIKIQDWIKLPQGGQTDLQLARRIYNQSMENNTRFTQRLQKQLDTQEGKYNQTRRDKQQASSRRQIVYKSYIECSSNRKEFTACQEISNEVSNINKDTLIYLKAMIDSKQQLLANLRNFLKQQSNSKQMEQMHEVYKQQLQEYRLMHREFINYNLQNVKACGCSEQQERNYRTQLQQLTKDQQIYRINLQRLSTAVDSLNQQIKRAEEQKQAIFQTYKQILRSAENVPVIQGSQLARLNRDLEQVSTEIVALKGKYYDLFSNCDTIKQYMAARIRGIDAVANCLAKKEYFQKLRGQTKAYLHPDSESSRVIQSRTQLVKYLSAFEI